MRPPRYLLREAVLEKILKRLPPGKFLEVGYGHGYTLLALSKAGFWGQGYDYSDDARHEAKKLLRKKKVTTITLLQNMDNRERYEYILFFEVIGYWKSPAEEISRLKEHLNTGGRIIFSFTNKRHQGYAEKVTGDYTCFTRSEILGMLHNEAGFKVDLIWNYGFPLTNILKPFLDIFHRWKSRSPSADKNMDDTIKVSGLATRFLLVKFISLLLNPISIYPFAMMQLLFKNTDLGTGYIVVAEKR
jgi:SAM-dependent methyltransferase